MRQSRKFGWQPPDSHLDVLWPSEDTRYDGGGTPDLNTEQVWYLPGNAAVVLAPKKFVRLLEQ